MKEKNSKSIAIKSSFLVMLFLTGCQLPKEKRLMVSDMQELLDQSTAETIKNNTPGNPMNFLQDFSKGSVNASNAAANLAAGSPKTGLFEKRFDVIADAVPAKAFFLSLVEDTHYNITVHPDVAGSISLQLKKVTIPQVLETVRNIYGYEYQQTPQGIEILPAAIQTRAFSVNYLDITRGGQSSMQVAAASLSGAAGGATGGGGSASASSLNVTTTADFWKELKIAVESIVGTAEGRKVAVSPLSNLIVVQAMPNELKRVEDFLKKAEISLNKQVILEAKILEVQLNEAYQAGINWGLVGGRMNMAQVGASAVNAATANGRPVSTADLVGSVNITPGNKSSTPLLGNGVSTFGGAFALTTNYQNLATFLDVLSAQGDVHVLSNPRVSTLNNQKALIKVGDDQFFITNISSTSSTVGNTTSNTPSVTFSPFFSGVSLDVTPHVTELDDVLLHIHPTISAVALDNREYTTTDNTGVAQKQTVPLAKTSVRESDSMVKAHNGELVIIGGLMQNKTVNLKQGIPVLGKLPVIGSLFRQTNQSVVKSELIILIRPIVLADGVASRITDVNLNRIQDMNEEIAQGDN